MYHVIYENSGKSGNVNEFLTVINTETAGSYEFTINHGKNKVSARFSGHKKLFFTGSAAAYLCRDVSEEILTFAGNMDGIENRLEERLKVQAVARFYESMINTLAAADND